MCTLSLLSLLRKSGQNESSELQYDFVKCVWCRKFASLRSIIASVMPVDLISMGISYWSTSNVPTMLLKCAGELSLPVPN